MARRAEITRDTNETKIRMTLNLDGSGQAEIYTGIGFFDHTCSMDLPATVSSICRYPWKAIWRWTPTIR